MTADLRSRRRSHYPYYLTYRTRWSDNDQYAHMNNAVYYHLFDSIINTYLAQQCGVSPAAPTASSSASSHPDARLIGLVVESHCSFFAPLGFPQVVHLGLRVNKVGRSAVAYEVGVFVQPDSEQTVREDGDIEKGLYGLETQGPAAVGGYTHVFVDRDSRRSAPMGDRLRRGLEALYAKNERAKL